MKTLPEIVRACLKDPTLKAKLIADPAAFLADRGFQVPVGVTIKVVENTSSVFHLVLPNTSAGGSLSDEELGAAAGGGGWLGGESVGCHPGGH